MKQSAVGRTERVVRGCIREHQLADQAAAAAAVMAIREKTTQLLMSTRRVDAAVVVVEVVSVLYSSNDRLHASAYWLVPRRVLFDFRR